MLRGLPSREWRNSVADRPVADYGAMHQAHQPATWRERAILWLAFVLGRVHAALKLAARAYRAAWHGARSLKSPSLRALASGALVVVTLLLVCAISLQTMNWFTRENPCTVLHRTKQYVMGEVTQGVFTTPLPKVIHVAWDDGNIPNGRLLEWNSELRRLFPETEFEHKIWTRETFLSLVKEKYEWYAASAEANRQPLQDWREAKYFILNEYGGLFIGVDYKVLRQFWDVLPKFRPAYLGSPYLYGADVEDVVMSSPPRHPLLNITLDLVRERMGQPSLLSNSRVLAQAIVQLKLSPLGPDSVYELPCELFYRFPHGEVAEFVPGYKSSTRNVLSALGLVRQCGDVENIRCHLGMYYENAHQALSEEGASQ